MKVILLCFWIGGTFSFSFSLRRGVGLSNNISRTLIGSTTSGWLLNGSRFLPTGNNRNNSHNHFVSQTSSKVFVNQIDLIRHVFKRFNHRDICSSWGHIGSSIACFASTNRSRVPLLHLSVENTVCSANKSLAVGVIHDDQHACLCAGVWSTFLEFTVLILFISSSAAWFTEFTEVYMLTAYISVLKSKYT